MYTGNAQNHNNKVYEYLSKYAAYIHRDQPHEISDITGESLQATAQQAENSAPGMDSWTADDMHLLPLKSFHILADMLNIIEHGKCWPQDLLHQKAALLAKNPEDLMDTKPLSEEVLPDLFVDLCSNFWRGASDVAVVAIGKRNGGVAIERGDGPVVGKDLLAGQPAAEHHLVSHAPFAPKRKPSSSP